MTWNWEKLILRALERYGLERQPWQILRHNENLTVRVGEEYLLRIHRPAAGIHMEPLLAGADLPALRRTELALLRHLGRKGLTVQRPLADRTGRDVTLLPDGTVATVLTWLPGDPLDPQKLTEALCLRLGAMVAELHRAAADFQGGAVLRYDPALCRRLRADFSRMYRAGCLDRRRLSQLEAACEAVAEDLTGEEGTTIHADLSPGNLLLTEQGPVAIDFSLSGWGHPMLDLAGLMGLTTKTALRQALAAGFIAGGGRIDRPMLDRCCCLRALINLALYLESRWREPAFVEGLEESCRHVFRPLAAGREIFREDLSI